MIRALRERRVAQFLVTYAAAGWLVLQLVDQVVDREVLPEVVYRVALTLVLCGFPGALIVSWFHGAKGAQRAPALEKWMLAGVGLFAVAASGWVARANLGSGAATLGASLDPHQDPSRVAVLYFDAQGGGEDAAFLASGLTESLIDELSAVEALHVISRNGSQAYRDTALPPDSVGRVLGVGTLVSGRVAVADERVRVAVSTVSVDDGSQTDAARIDLPRADLFDLQDSLTAQVSDFLRQAIGSEVNVQRRRRGTASVEAWEQFQRAAATQRDAVEAAGHGDVDVAHQEYRRADTLLAQSEATDGTWIAPVVERGWIAYRQSRLGGFDRAGYAHWIEEGLGHADRALALAPADADALELKGTLIYWRYLLNLAGTREEADAAFHSAEELFRASINANPEQASALTSLSHLLLNKGEIAQAKLMAERSYAADPFLDNVHLTLWRLARSSWDLADAVESRRWCDAGLARFPEDYRFRQCQLMLYALPDVSPDPDALWRRYEEFVERAPHQTAQLNEHQGLQYVAMGLVRAGLPDSARAVAIRGRAPPDVDPIRDVALLEAITRGWLGDMKEAVGQMGVYLAANPSLVEAYQASVESGDIHWYLRELAEDPGFRDLVGARR
ncbi:MAG: hypothetical protein HKO53_06580 [Gemmatimonadetes bacterium]|nr:hypothetical protein [Gemmatimonadota bacterium]